MDSYKKVLKELNTILNNLDSKLIPEVSNKIETTQKTIRLYEDQKSFFADDKEEKEYDYYVVTNYKKLKRQAFLKALGKILLYSIPVSLIFVLPNLIMNVPITALPLVICETIVTAIIAKQYSDDVFEVNEINKKYKVEPINFSDYIRVLTSTIEEIDEIIKGNSDMLIRFRGELDCYKAKRNVIISYINKINEKRNAQVETLASLHLPELDLAFASDDKAIEILKLERTLNNGKNI